MGTVIPLHLVVGMVVGWAILSPLAVGKGWVTGKVDDYEQGVKGWLIWIALSILLADSAVQLGWMIFRICARSVNSILDYSHHERPVNTPTSTSMAKLRRLFDLVRAGQSESSRRSSDFESPSLKAEPPSPPLYSSLLVSVILSFVIFLSMSLIYASFHEFLQLVAVILAVCIGLLAAVIGTRVLGETDTLPNSAIAKFSQLVFRFTVPVSNHGAVVANLLAGSISESTSERAGQMMQDFKTAQLSSISAKVQLQGGFIGGLFGAIISPILYRMYTSVYEFPSPLFQMPHAYLYILTARLLMGQGLPKMVPQVGFIFGFVFFVFAATRIALAHHPTSKYHQWYNFVPSGVAVAIGIYTTPSFTLARVIGGFLNYWYLRRYPTNGTDVTLLASGLVIGEGLTSIINLVLARLHIPHF
jgi:OPT family oligopeptide transporter